MKLTYSQLGFSAKANRRFIRRCVVCWFEGGFCLYLLFQKGFSNRYDVLWCMEVELRGFHVVLRYTWCDKATSYFIGSCDWWMIGMAIAIWMNCIYEFNEHIQFPCVSSADIHFASSCSCLKLFASTSVPCPSEKKLSLSCMSANSQQVRIVF